MFVISATGHQVFCLLFLVTYRTSTRITWHCVAPITQLNVATNRSDGQKLKCVLDISISNYNTCPINSIFKTVKVESSILVKSSKRPRVFL